MNKNRLKILNIWVDAITKNQALRMLDATLVCSYF